MRKVLDSEKTNEELSKIADAAKAAATRASDAIDDMLSFVEASNRRIQTMEAKAREKRMNLFSFFRRKKRKSAEDTNTGRTSPSVAKAVLAFLALGLTDGIESITQSYKPTKVDEFVTVSKAILKALKQGYENKFSSGFVVMSMKINEQQKQIELTQLGRNVMLSLDTTTDIITSITLTEIYANLRIDIIKHPEIYGKDLHLIAGSFPDPGKTHG